MPRPRRPARRQSVCCRARRPLEKKAASQGRSAARRSRTEGGDSQRRPSVVESVWRTRTARRDRKMLLARSGSFQTLRCELCRVTTQSSAPLTASRETESVPSFERKLRVVESLSSPSILTPRRPSLKCFRIAAWLCAPKISFRSYFGFSATFSSFFVLIGSVMVVALEPLSCGSAFSLIVSKCPSLCKASKRVSSRWTTVAWPRLRAALRSTSAAVPSTEQTQNARPLGFLYI